MHDFSFHVYIYCSYSSPIDKCKGFRVKAKIIVAYEASLSPCLKFGARFFP